MSLLAHQYEAEKILKFLERYFIKQMTVQEKKKTFSEKKSYIKNKYNLKGL